MILVTGHRGFIGKQICKHLDNFIGFDLKEGDDIRYFPRLERTFKQNKITAVIHLAAKVGVRDGEADPLGYFDTNVLGTRNLLKLCEKYKVKKLIHFSSSSVFGNDTMLWSKEDDEKFPKSIYGMTKLMGELLVKKSNLNYTIIRPFTVIGFNGRKNQVIYKWIDQARRNRSIPFFGNGETYRGYVVIDDLIRGVLLCLKKVSANRKDFNLGGSQKIKLSELWLIFKKYFPNAERELLPLPLSDQKYSFANTAKAEHSLNWYAEIDTKKFIEKICRLEAEKN
jgi:UDP-glucuronate 4-epimerase